MPKNCGLLRLTVGRLLSAGSDGQHAQGERGQAEEARLSSHDDDDSQTPLLTDSVQDEQEQPTLA